MDMSTPGDCFRIDDLLDFSSNQHLIITTSSNSSSTQSQSHHLPPPQHPFPHHHHPHPDPFFTNLPSVPSDEAAELEWLSHFVDDTFHDFPPNQTMGIKSDTDTDTSSFPKSYNNVPSSCSSKVRRCSHCASEKTPQWRTGPLGPKTLCNACGVRFKSGRLVPEYRPASSPTFVLTQHSNSHRKVMELRRQKELLKHKQQEEQCYHFKVC